MLERQPLVLINGNWRELPPSDFISGRYPTPVYVSGRYYSLAPVAPTVTTIAVAANSIRATPLQVREDMPIDQIISGVTTAVAGTLYRLAYYSDNQGYPGSIIAGTDAIEYSGATTGVRTGTVNLTLPSGRIWLAWNANGAPTLRAMAASSVDDILGISAALGTTAVLSQVAATLTYGPLPATFPAGGTASNAAVPLAAVRRV